MFFQKTKNRKHRPQIKLNIICCKNKESQAPSPNELGDNLFQKQRIASTVPKTIWKETFSNTKNRKHRPQTNFKIIFFKHKESQTLSPDKFGRNLFKNEESQAPSPNKIWDNLLQKTKSQASSPNQLWDNLFQTQRIASTVPRQIWKEPFSKTTNCKHRPQTKFEITCFKKAKSQAPSPNQLWDNLLQTQRIASTVPRQIWKEPFPKTTNRKHRPQSNLKIIFFKNKESQAPSLSSPESRCKPQQWALPEPLQSVSKASWASPKPLQSLCRASLKPFRSLSKASPEPSSSPEPL